MRNRRDLGVLVLAVAAAAIVLPAFLSGPDLDRAATALALSGPAAGAAVALAVGRPNLAVGALAGVGAYVSGALALRGIPEPLAVVLAVAGCAVGGALVAVVTARLDVVGLLAVTLLTAVGLTALTQALPRLSGGQAGLGPLPALGTNLPGSRVLRLTPSGDLHASLAAALLITVVAVILLGGRRGALWRAVGSDRLRAVASGLRPLAAEVVAMAAAGALAGFGGALSAHINGVATPDAFAADVVALPLLAALLAGPGRALGAILAAVATGLLAGLVLPDLGWRGPPSSTALALGLLAIAVVASLLPGAAVARPARPTDVAEDEPWPVAEDEFPRATLTVDGLDVRAGPLTLVRGLALRAPAGTIHGLVGPNGAGKSSVLAAIASASAPVVRLEGLNDGAIVLQPQAGGGFPACSVDETLELAAAGGGRQRGEAARVAALWRARLGLDGSGATLCSDLSAGRRRLLDLARVLLRRPAVMLCDEPLAGLDPAARAAAVSLLRAAAAAGLTIVLAEHDRSAVAALASDTTALTRPELQTAAEPAA